MPSSFIFGPATDRLNGTISIHSGLELNASESININIIEPIVIINSEDKASSLIMKVGEPITVIVYANQCKQFNLA